MCQASLRVCYLSVCAFVVTSCSDSLTERDKAFYREACAPVIAWVGREYERSGVYPPRLPARLEDVLNKLGLPAIYRLEDDGKVFCIAIGDYSSRHTFVYYYYPHTGWAVDL